MKSAERSESVPDPEPVRVLGRGLRVQRGVRLTLRMIREATGRTQTEVASLSRIDQGDVSRLEQREAFDDCQVATLRRYVEALGGTLDLVARFGERKIMISGVEGEVATDQGSADDRPRLPVGSPGRGRRRST